MTKKEKAVAFLIKQRDIETTMLNNMHQYISSSDRRYSRIKKSHVETIELIDYILLRL